MKKHALLTTSLLFPAAMALGAGYQLNLQGLRQLAMGGGGCAVPWDASTIFYNPGGLSRLKGMQAYGSVQFIMPRVKYIQTPTGGTEASTVAQTFPTFNFYLGGPVTKGGRLGVGLGVYTPFGSGVKWEDNWTGRYITRNISLQTIFVQPTLSYRINDGLSIGAGFVYSFGGVQLERAIPVQNAAGEDGKAELKGKASGIGYNIGASFKASERLYFGLTYRSRVDMEVKDGDATFTVPSSLAGNFPATTSFTSSLPLPSVFSLGIGIKPLERMTVQAEINYVAWEVYQTLSFDYQDNTPALQDTRAARNYRNRVAARLGAHYQATDALEIMLGSAIDPTPVSDNFVSPDLPDANRLVLTGGFTFKPAPKLTVMAAVEYVTSQKRLSNYAEVNFSGRYQTKAVTPGIGITYDF